MSDHIDLVAKLRDSSGGHINGLYDQQAADAIKTLAADNEALRLLLHDALSALEYHVEQTRPVHSTTTAIQAIRHTLKAKEHGS